MGFNVDHDHRLGDNVRFVQLTPPGSACSIVIGTGITDASPGSVQGTLLVVSDIDAARAELSARGVRVLGRNVSSGAVAVVLAVAAPLIAIVLWGRFAAPRGPRRLAP